MQHTSTSLLRSLLTRATLATTVLAAAAFPATADEIQVTIQTVAPADGVFLTPLWVGFHDGAFDTYNRGEAITPGLERLVEDGNTAPFSDEFSAAAASGSQATLVGPNGPIFSGDSATMTFDLDPATHSYFSYASMVIPSNDAFVSNGNPLAHRVFDPNGNFTPFEFYILGSETLDGGTEVNDETEANTAALGQAAPDTGDTEGGVVTTHPGFLAGGRVLTARPNGDFTAPGYILAKVSVTRGNRTTLRFTGSGAQENPPVTTTATAACSAALNGAQDAVTVSCEHNVADPIAAHIHSGIAGENGSVLFPFADFASPISESFAVDATQVADLLAGGLYVNIHSTANPGGEVRAQIDGCFAGPESLCLLGNRFEVSATFATTQGTSGAAQSRVATSDSGQFTFFDAANVELDVKVLDGCGVNNSYWVFIAGLTDVEVDITVTDTATGETQKYTNEQGNPFELVRDITAFGPCS